MEKALRVRCLLPLALLAGCSGSPSPARPVLADFRVLERGQDQGGEFCSDFNLTPAQTARYFDRATTLTPSEEHDGFEVLPCWVRGTARGAGGTWQWEVRAGGTARIVAPGGVATLLGCKACELEMGAPAEPPKQ